MDLDKEEISDRLSMRILNFVRVDKEDINKIRRKRISEAVNWDGGPSTENPKKIKIDETKSGRDVYFLKPGKEVNNSKNPNPNDMTPRVGEIYTDYTFQDMWSLISRLSVKDFDLFVYFLVLIYRNAFFVDHTEISEGVVRYRPEDEIVECIDYLDEELNDVIPGSIWDALHFLDVLGWNEDVKYQAEGTDRDLSKDFYIGRLNNMLTSIKIPYKLALFVNQIIDKSERPEEIDFSEGLDTMQSLSISRGVAKPTQGELESWFSPTLYK